MVVKKKAALASLKDELTSRFEVLEKLEAAFNDKMALLDERSKKEKDRPLAAKLQARVDELEKQNMTLRDENLSLKERLGAVAKLSEEYDQVRTRVLNMCSRMGITAVSSSLLQMLGYLNDRLKR